MQKRNPLAVFFLPFITFGIYGIYWEVKTKGEINRLTDANVPTAWLIIIPIVNIWWLWKYCEGVEKVTKEQMSTVIAFLVLMLLGSIGMAIVQDSFNKVGEAPGVPTNPVGPMPTPQPPVNPTPPVNPGVPPTPPVSPIQ